MFPYREPRNYINRSPTDNQETNNRSLLQNNKTYGKPRNYINRSPRENQETINRSPTAYQDTYK